MQPTTLSPTFSCTKYMQQVFANIKLKIVLVSECYYAEKSDGSKKNFVIHFYT